MKLEELKKIIENAKQGEKEFTLADIAKYHPMVKLKLEIDKNTQNYFYKIDEKALNESTLNENDILDLYLEGWRFDDENNFLFKKI